MAQFIGRVQGNRQETTKLGHKTSGLRTECNGYKIGVKCVARYNKITEKDEIAIYITNGSGYGGLHKHIHTTYDGEFNNS